MSSLFPSGINGLADTKFSGVKGACAKLVGIDYRSKPGLITAHQKLVKNSPNSPDSDEVNELTKVPVDVSDGSTLWFSAVSGKIWRELNGAWTLVHTLNVLTDYTDPTPTLSTTFPDDLTATNRSAGYRINPSGSAFPVIVEDAHNNEAGSSTTISASITVPAGSNQLLVCMAGNYTGEAGTGVTDNAVAMSPISSGSSSSGGLSINTTLARKVAPGAGSHTVEVTFANATVNRFIYLFVIDGVDQTTPISTTAGNGESDSPAFLDLPGTANYQMRLGLVASLQTPHVQAGTQTEVITDETGSAGTESVSYRNYYVGASIVLGAEEHLDSIYFATEMLLFSILVSDLASWSGNIESVGVFLNGNDTYHPMVLKNLQLFIGDGDLIAKVTEQGAFESQTSLNVEQSEVITTLIDFDIDILIGTKDINRCRILRWDTVSESWSAEDVIDDTEVFAFLRDDNYVYALVGESGRWYFYDGEKLVPYQRIPGTWTTTKRGRVNANATGFLLGVPVFGLSNAEGNPTEQGVYGFGSYSKDYPKTMSLDFPISPDVFADLEIGAIITRGAMLMVSWKTASAAGVDKLDYTAKYPNAYLETMILTALENRSNYKTVARVQAPYNSMPTGCGVTFGYKKKNEVSYTNMTGIVNDAKLVKMKAEKSIPEIASLQLRLGLTVSGNNAPELEDLQMDMVGESTQTKP